MQINNLVDITAQKLWSKIVNVDLVRLKVSEVVCGVRRHSLLVEFFNQEELRVQQQQVPSCCELR